MDEKDCTAGTSASDSKYKQGLSQRKILRPLLRKQPSFTEKIREYDLHETIGESTFGMCVFSIDNRHSALLFYYYEY